MATIKCRCGSVRIDFPTNAELFRHECCCHDCISALWYATKRGGRHILTIYAQTVAGCRTTFVS
jgi:hypothetical protein